MRVLTLPDPVGARMGQFTGRAWVLPSLLRWFDETTDRYLILTGPPGSGKSTLVAWLAGWGPAPDGAEEGGHLERVRALAAAAHFCRFDSGNVAPKAFAEAMSGQLTACVEGFSDALVAALGRDLVRMQANVQVGEVQRGGHVTGFHIERLDLRNLEDEVGFDLAFRDPLIKLYERGYAEPMLLLVDGLDEARAYTGTPLVRLLARLGDLPAQVRFLLTTRPDQRVLAFFRQAQRVDLIGGAPAKADDVGRYATRRLRDAFWPAEPKGTAALAAQVSAAAQGNFLYAYLVLNGLPDIGETRPLPKDLSGIYHDFLLREVTPDESLWPDVYGPLLGLLAVAEEPGLTKTQLERIIGQDVERALRACLQFLSGDLPGGPFRFFHRSFADFLLGEDGEDIDFHIDASRIHRRVTGYYLGANGHGTGVDDYGLRHLAAHLELAGQADTLHELLGRGQCHDGQWENAWYAAKAAAGQLDGYQADVERAYRLAAENAATDLQARYVLYLSSLRGTAVRVPARLLELCLHEDVLTWQQVLDSARLHHDPVARARAISRVIRSARFPPEERDRAAGAEYAVAAGLDDDEQRGSSFAELADVLPGHLVDDLIARTAGIESGEDRAGIFTALAGRLNRRQIAAALPIARSVAEPAWRVRAMLALASGLGGQRREERLAEVRAVIAGMETTATKAVALAELAGLEATGRQEETIDQALVIADGLDYWEGLAGTLGAVARLGTPTVSAERVARMLELAWRAKEEGDYPGIQRNYVVTLAALGPLMSEEQRESYIDPCVAMWHLALTTSHRSVAIEFVPPLVAYLPEAKRDAFFTEYLEPLVQVAANRESGPAGWLRPQALAGLARLPQPLVDAAVEVAEEPPPDEGRERPLDEGQADVLAILVPRLPSERRAPVLRRELARVRRIDDGYARLDALAALVPHLAGDLRAALAEEVLAASPPLTRRETYSGGLVPWFGAFERVGALAPCLVPERTAAVLDHAFDAALTIDDPRFRAEALEAIVPVLPAAKIREAVPIARSLGDVGYILLAALVPRLPDDQRHAETAWVLKKVRRDIPEMSADVVRALRGVAPYLDDAQVVTALELTRQLQDYDDPLQADAIGILAPYLRGRALDMAMSLAGNLEGLPRVRAATALIPLLPGPQRPAALREARETADGLTRDKERAQALTALAPLVADPQAARAEALQAAMATDDYHRPGVLGDLLPHLGPADQLDAVDTVFRSCLPTSGAGTDRVDRDRELVLKHIAAAAGTLASLGGQPTVAEITRAIQETTLWWP